METTTPTNARNPIQRKIIQEFLEKGEDPFDRKNIEQIYDEDEHGNKKYNQVIAQNDSWYAIPCLWPLKNASNHFIIIAMRNGIISPNELTNTERKEFFDICKRISKTYGIDTGAICMRFGIPTAAGTTVTHLHAHLISPEGFDSVSFHIGNYNNPNKTTFDAGEKGTRVRLNDTWQAESSVADCYILELLKKRTRSFIHLDFFERIDLFLIIKDVISTEKIQGGGFCMPFGDTIPPQGELKGFLINNNPNSTFEFIIKNQNQEL